MKTKDKSKSKTNTKATKKTMTGAAAILESFIQEGVGIMFGYPGGAIMPLYDAMCDYPRIRHILVRHEQGAVHAAQGYARVSGKPGVCIATSGPGATNLITGITDAMIDSTPLICITGQVASQSLGTDAFQEAPIIGMTTPVTKWCYQITDAKEIPKIMAKAFHIATTGRPGPVLIDVTKNAQMGLLDFTYSKKVEMKGYKPIPAPDMQKIQAAAELLNNAKHPYILAGHGILISKAEKELLDVAETGGFPIAATLLGLSSIPADHPLYMGMLGMHGNYGPNKQINKADVILAVGMRFDDRVTGKASEYAKHARIIHIDIDQAELNKIKYAEVAIQTDAKQALAMLAPLIKKTKHTEWISQFKKFDEEEFKKVSQAELSPKSGPITMAEVINMISKKTKGDAVILADVGQHQMAAARYYKFQKTDSFVTSGGLGTMGFALPASMGAKLAAPGREVIAIIGDGSFQMTMQEMGTIAQEKLPVKIIILNNHHLGMVRQWQEMFFEERYSFVSMQNPEFTTIADAYKMKSASIKERKYLAAAIDKMLATNEPYLLDIHVKKDEKIFPIVPSGASVDDIRLE